MFTYNATLAGFKSFNEGIDTVDVFLIHEKEF
jgi:hypothetical protein